MVAVYIYIYIYMYVCIEMSECVLPIYVYVSSLCARSCFFSASSFYFVLSNIVWNACSIYNNFVLINVLFLLCSNLFYSLLHPSFSAVCASPRRRRPRCAGAGALRAEVLGWKITTEWSYLGVGEVWKSPLCGDIFVPASLGRWAENHHWVVIFGEGSENHHGVVMFKGGGSENPKRVVIFLKRALYFFKCTVFSPQRVLSLSTQPAVDLIRWYQTKGCEGTQKQNKNHMGQMTRFRAGIVSRYVMALVSLALFVFPALFILCFFIGPTRHRRTPELWAIQA